MELRDDDADDGGLYDYLLDSGALDDVRTVAESIASPSSVSAEAEADDEDARRIADRLLERNADAVDRALDAIARDARLADGQLVDWRWPRLADVGPGRPAARQALRNLDALARLPFTYDTYAGPFFRRLTQGLERAVAADAAFGPAARAYAKLVDAAPDADAAAESFASLCEAVHLRCVRPQPLQLANTVAAVCLMARCLSAVCGRAAGVKHGRPVAVIEFVAAAVAGDPSRDDSPYAVLCCADPTAGWFDRVARCSTCRVALFDCVAGDRRLLKATVGGLVAWLAEPWVPARTEARGAVVVGYARALHALYLLARAYRYRAARALFPVRVSRTTRVHGPGLAGQCLAYLQRSADHDSNGPPPTLGRGLCELVAVVAAHHPEVATAAALHPYGARVLARVCETAPAAIGLDRAIRRLLDAPRRGRGADDSLFRVAAALCSRRDCVRRLVTGCPWLLEQADRRYSTDARCRSLVTDARCSPLAALVGRDDAADPSSLEFDWSDPVHRISFGVSCAVAPGRRWLRRTGAFRAADAFVRTRLREAETSPEDCAQLLNAVVAVAQAYCASVEGLRILLENDDDTETVGKLSELYRLSYDEFDGHAIARDAVVMLWLRLIEAATHAFNLRVYADLELKYQDTLTKLSAENRTGDGVTIVDERTELLTKLRRPVSSADSHYAEQAASDVSAFLAAKADRCSGWSQRARSAIIRSERVSGAEMTDLIVASGRRRFDGRLDLDAFDRPADLLTDFDVAGIRSATRYGSSVGLVAEEDAAELERVYGCIERRPATGLFDCAVCTLFVACRGSRNKCVEACAVVARLDETTRYFRPPAFDEDAGRRAAFGHLVEELLQQEQPEVFNAFKMSGVSWWLLCSGWTSDCFWGRLSWPEICRWLCLVVLSPVDYQAYFLVVLAAARKRQWLEAFVQGRFCDTVYRGDFGDFRLADHAEYLETLAKRHQRFVSKRLASEFA